MSGTTDPLLPCPLLNIRIELPPDVVDPAASIHDELQRLPGKPGVYALRDDSQGTLALASTSNLRRAIASRLEPPADNSPTRRVDYRALARVVLATTVGSAFEADWAYLQLARIQLPHTYHSVLDRWHAWFIAIDPTDRFPQFVKTAHPKGPSSGESAVIFGPFGDKHAAARYMDLLQDVFDLCRYHHILVQAPNGSACAYKEMGRCPAPCDGTVSMGHYHDQIRQAVAFAAMLNDQWRQNTEAAMKRAAISLDFESARRLREQLDRSTPAARPSFSHIRRLDDFRFLAVCRGERKNWARLFLIRGGWIEPHCDLRNDSSKNDLNAIVDDLHARSQPRDDDWCDAALENIGLVCWHLFRPRAKNTTLDLIRLDQRLTATVLAKSLRRITRKEPEESDNSESIDEHEMETGSSPTQ